MSEVVRRTRGIEAKAEVHAAGYAPFLLFLGVVEPRIRELLAEIADLLADVAPDTRFEHEAA